MLHLVNLAMHKAVCAPPGGPQHRRTGPLRFWRLLPSSFFRARFSLSSRVSMRSLDLLIFHLVRFPCGISDFFGFGPFRGLWDILSRSAFCPQRARRYSFLWSLAMSSGRVVSRL